MTHDYDELGKRRWRTREGQVMTWSEMTPRHLRNAANFIVKSHQQRLSSMYSMACMFTGDMASYELDKAINHEEDAGLYLYDYAAEMRAYADYRERKDL